jgi:hypothetical protein
MPPSHHRALQDIRHCRTEVLGGHVYVCNQCGHRQFAYHSCKNRNCPKCQREDTDLWLQQRRQELLAVPYFHVVFTLPKEFHEIVRHHQKALYRVLMQAAAGSLMKLAADPRYVGGQLGILAVLHTWTTTLTYHPHVHCLVPAGGVSSDERWLPARKDYLVPIKALSKIFRGMFVEIARQTLPQVVFPDVARTKSWVVYCKPAVQGNEKVLRYVRVHSGHGRAGRNSVMGWDTRWLDGFGRRSEWANAGREGNNKAATLPGSLSLCFPGRAPEE